MRRACPNSVFRALFSLVPLFFLLQSGSLTVCAETLQKYREDVEYIRNRLTYFNSISPENLEEKIEAKKKIFEEVSDRLPPREEVEWQGIKIEVDNRWLHDRLNTIKRLASGSLQQDEDEKVVTELSERLSALDVKLKELEGLPSGSRNKDEEKQKLEQILKRSEYQTDEKPKEESALQRWIKAFLDWLRDLLPRGEEIDPVEPSKPVGPGISSAVVLVLIFGLVSAIIAFVIWRVIPLLENRRARKKEKKGGGERIILGERLAIDESSSTLFDQAEQMAREGNFRGAIRKGYIALLCELGDRKIVRIAQHKTNRDYLSDVRKNQELHGGMRDLTFMFENHWYGLASASDEEWSAFRENYRRSTRVI